MIYIYVVQLLCQLVIPRDLWFLFVINRSFILLIVRLFASFSFPFDSLLFVVQKWKEQFWSWTVFRNFDPIKQKKLPATCSSTRCTCSSIQHHHLESINIIQQTPLTLSYYRKRKTYYHHRHSGIDETNILHIDNHRSGRDTELTAHFLEVLYGWLT